MRSNLTANLVIISARYRRVRISAVVGTGLDNANSIVKEFGVYSQIIAKFSKQVTRSKTNNNSFTVADGRESL